MASNHVEPLQSAQELSALADSFKRSRILLTAVELDVFSVLDKGKLTSAEVAVAVGADPRGMDRLLRACCALGLARVEPGESRDRDLFFNTAAGANHLVRGKEGFLGALDHQNNLYHTWGRLTDSVRKGGTVLEEPDMADRDGSWFEPFMAAMYSRARIKADELVARLDLAGVRSVLDVGGGPGAHAMAFARARDGIRATVFDLPQVTPITQRYVKKDGMEHMVDTRSGNFRTDRLAREDGKGYDLVFVSAILHMLSPSECLSLLAKVHEATAPGGQGVVLDFVMDEDRLSPEFGALFALNMLVGTAHGDSYTRSEISGWMQECGFGDIRRIQAGPDTAFIVGRKQG